MATKDIDGSDRKKLEELDDITTCCICMEVFTDPKALPCIHTFCMKCLREVGFKTNKGPGDEMPCPICRGLFRIPAEGFPGLPKHFFIERLIQMSTVPNQSTSVNIGCDACLEENKEESGKEIPPAATYCVDCNQKYCEECCRQHKKFKLTKNHKLIQINEYDGGQNFMNNLTSSVCKVHVQKVLDVYCADCKTVLCAICFIEEHNNHKGSHVDKLVDGFKKQIESNAETIKQYRSKAETKKVELFKAREDIQNMIEKLECEIGTSKDELKQLTEKHEASLLQDMYLIKQSKLKEIQTAMDDIDAYLSSLETYNSYCQTIMDKGSANDMCGAIADLSVRAVELQQQCQPLIEREIQCLNSMLFRKSDLCEFLEENCVNLIGEIKVNCNDDTNARKHIRHIQGRINELEDKLSLAENENRDLFVRLTKSEVNADSVKALNIRQAKNGNEKSVVEEKRQRQVAYSDMEAQLKDQELREAVDKREETQQMLNETQTKLCECQETIDNLELLNHRKEQEVNETLGIIEKLKDQLKHYKTALHEAEERSRDTNEKLVERELALKETTAKLKEIQTNFKDTKTKSGENKVHYKDDPILVKTIRTKAAEGNGKGISGLAIADDELFMTSFQDNDIEVYDLKTFTLTRSWKLDPLINPYDLVCCNTDKCLYVMDITFIETRKMIFKLNLYGKFLNRWTTRMGYGCISVTYDCNVVMAEYEGHTITEYTPDGQIVREIKLSIKARFSHPRHAIKLTGGSFLISHGDGDNSVNRVCVVDAIGDILMSFGGPHGSTSDRLNNPIYLTIDSSGSVFVVDRNNSRVLALTSGLEFMRELIPSRKEGMHCPERMVIDQANGRLFVAHSDVYWSEYRVSVFQIC